MVNVIYFFNRSGSLHLQYHTIINTCLIVRRKKKHPYLTSLFCRGYLTGKIHSNLELQPLLPLLTNQYPVFWRVLRGNKGLRTSVFPNLLQLSKYPTALSIMLLRSLTIAPLALLEGPKMLEMFNHSIWPSHLSGTVECDKVDLPLT